MAADYKPFLISEFKSGISNYLKPWIRPNDAFEPCENAFVYRGCLQKRNGYRPLTRMLYRDVSISLGTGNAVQVTFAGTLSKFPIVAGQFNPRDRLETFTDNGLGVLTGSAGGTGTINYTTGAYSFTFAAAPAMGELVAASYSYYPMDQTPPIKRPIMALKSFVNSQDQQLLLICDTRRMGSYDSNGNVVQPIAQAKQDIFIGDGSTTTIVVNVNWMNIAPYTVTLRDGTTTIQDNGSGVFPPAGNFAAGTLINYASGNVTLVFVAAPASTVTISLEFTPSGDIWSGSNNNFFNAATWNPDSSGRGSGNIYLVNGVDPITLFDGLFTSRPPFPITLAHKKTFTNDIVSCLDIKIYKNRLLAIRPQIVGVGNPDGQSVRYSAILNPTNLVADFAGNGGELSAPTADWIQSFTFLRDNFIAALESSYWIFRFTGNQYDPFRFDILATTKSCNAPYASIGYDERTTHYGNRGQVACDGVNVQRYDISIIDQFLDIYQPYASYCFGLRFDTINQTWMLYPSVEVETPASDKVQVYNFIENNWATFNLPMSCLGTYLVTSDVTFEDFAPGTPLGNEFPTWDDCDFPWDYYADQAQQLSLIGGGFAGDIYVMNDGETDNGAPISANITSTRWNPFVGIGQRTQFGYIDFYYEISTDCTLQIQFFTNNSSAPAATRTLTLTGPTNDDSSMSRVYVNLVGEFIQMNITSSSPASFKINGLVLWAKPSGRLTPGKSQP